VPSSATWGATITIKDTTKNRGTVSANPSTTKYYLSTDTVFDGGDTEISGHAVDTLAAGASFNGTATWTIPTGTTKRIYYIIARADGGGVIDETDENNNNRAIKFEVK